MVDMDEGKGDRPGAEWINNLFSIERTLFLDDGAEIPIKPSLYNVTIISLA